jgi:putative FmdB family regulatory protein
VPIYEYRCPNGHTFEVFQKMSDPPVETCTTCGAGPVEKLLFPVAVHFKGSGFYSTDYGKGRKKAVRDGGDSSTSASKGTSDKSTAEKGSGDKKPAADAGA